MEITDYAEYAQIKRRFDMEVQELQEQAAKKNKELQELYDGIRVRLNRHVYVIQSVFSKVWSTNSWNLRDSTSFSSSKWAWALGWDWKIVGVDEEHITIQWNATKARVNGRHIPSHVEVPVGILSMSDRQVAYLARTDAWRTKANISYAEEREAKSHRKSTKSQIRSLEKKLTQLEKDVARLEEKTSEHTDYLNGRAARTFEVRRNQREAAKANQTTTTKAEDAL